MKKFKRFVAVGVCLLTCVPNFKITDFEVLKNSERYLSQQQNNVDKVNARVFIYEGNNITSISKADISYIGDGKTISGYDNMHSYIEVECDSNSMLMIKNIELINGKKLYDVNLVVGSDTTFIIYIASDGKQEIIEREDLLGSNDVKKVIKSEFEVSNEPLTCKVKNITLGKGETWRIPVSGGTGKYKFSGNRVSVNSQGVVKANKTGTGSVIIESGNQKIEIKVVVKNAPKQIKFKNKSAVVKKGKKARVRYSLNSGSASNRITVISSNPKVVSGYNNYSGVIIEGKSKGTAILTIKTYNGRSARIQVEVE